MFAVAVKRVEGVKKLFLALFAFAEELDVVDNEDIDRSEPALKTREVALLDGLDEMVHKFFATEESYDGGFAYCFVTDGVEQMRFAQSGTAVNKERIIGIAGGLTDGDAACVGEPIARPDNKIVEGIIRMKGHLIFMFMFRGTGFWAAVGGKLDCDEMARYLPGGLREALGSYCRGSLRRPHPGSRFRASRPSAGRDADCQTISGCLRGQGLLHGLIYL